MKNRLCYGDNLNILREHFPDESVDLIYLDPPFNSNRNYNVLFKSQSGADSEAQITAFEDTWRWGETAEATYDDLIVHAPPKVSTAIEALMNLIERNQMMAYLVMMTARLVELHRVLKPTGSLYLHCDPTASHYLKIVLDAIFGVEHFRNEIVWKRTWAHNDPKRYGRITDAIFLYTKSSDFIWNTQYTSYSEEYVKKFFRFEDERGQFRTVTLTGPKVSSGDSGSTWRGYSPTSSGRSWSIPKRIVKKLAGEEALSWTIKERLDLLDEHGYIYWPPKGSVPHFKQYLHEMPGVPVQNLWIDIDRISPHAKERLGYPTQKPIALLERIILASSNEGDIILDPFCGCGTAIAAAHKLNRRWTGIDITHLSIALQKYRLADTFELISGTDYEVIGEPATVDAARALAHDSANEGRYQFEWWALSLVRAKPLGGQTGSRKGKKGADQGIDGIINFLDEDDKNRKKPQKVIIQVKSGQVKAGDIRDLKGTAEREQAAIAVFITLEKPTRAMQKEALAAGFYESPLWNQRYRKLQILTIGDLFDGAFISMPPQHGTHRQAERYKPSHVSGEGKSQQDLFSG